MSSIDDTGSEHQAFPWDDFLSLDERDQRLIARLVVAMVHAGLTLEEWQEQLDEQGRPGILAEDWLERRMPDWAMTFLDDLQCA